MQSHSLAEVNLSAIDDATLQALIDGAFAERARRDIQSGISDRAFFDTATDGEIIKHAETQYPGAPIGLASWYKETWAAQHRIRCNHLVRDRSRAPVFMKGAKWILVDQYALSSHGGHNGWAIRVFWRWVRVMRLTCLDRDDFAAKTEAVRKSLHSKYNLTNSFDEGTAQWAQWFDPVIGGRKSHLTPQQVSHIKALLAISKQTEKLDQKVKRAMIKQHMMERLAA